MRKKLVVIVLLMTIAILSACTSNGYRVYKEDGKYYLSLEHTAQDNSDNHTGHPPIQYIAFDSMSEMVNDIKKGNFTEDEMGIILSDYALCENIGYPFLLPDLDNLYEPILPEGYEINSVEWRMSSYTFTAVNGECRITISPLEESTYNDRISRVTQKIEEGSPAYYTISGGESVYYVWMLEPNDVNVYGIRNGQYFEAAVRNMESPSDEFLVSIGVKPYTD